jgi:uncharacterized protein with ATP-grasp and redox domains
MKTSVDCMACFVRQSLDAARRVSQDPAVHERIVRDVMGWAAEMDYNLPPPVLAQRIHRHLGEITGVVDPYRTAKEQSNHMALALLPELKTRIDTAADPLMMAVRLAIAGNVIDLGAKTSVSSGDLGQAIEQALTTPLTGPLDAFRQAVAEATHILYLADNAGEIVFDGLLIEQLNPERVTLAVRGFPILNDATMLDARAVGLVDIVDTIENGSDVPGTLLEDCSKNFRQHFEAADLIIAKGQGNFETLSRNSRDIFFLFKAKCPVIAQHVGVSQGAHVLIHKNEQC